MKEQLKIRKLAMKTAMPGIVRCPICKKLFGLSGFNSHYITHFKDGKLKD